MKKSSPISLKDKSKNLKCHLPQFLFGALKVNNGSMKLNARFTIIFRTSTFALLL